MWGQMLFPIKSPSHTGLPYPLWSSRDLFAAITLHVKKLVTANIMQSRTDKTSLFHAQLEHFCYAKSSERHTVIKES